jgi:hypothetical protein
MGENGSKNRKPQVHRYHRFKNMYEHWNRKLLVSATSVCFSKKSRSTFFGTQKQTVCSQEIRPIDTIRLNQQKRTSTSSHFSHRMRDFVRELAS